MPDSRTPRRRASLAAVILVLLAGAIPAALAAADPRQNLGAGWTDAQTAANGVELEAHLDRPPGFFNPASPGAIAFANSDLALSGDRAFVGNFNGFNIYDISNASAPVHLTSVVCPGGQGDLSVYGDLLFMSVEETRARIDCGTSGASGPVNPDRFRGVRIFDISNIAAPVQVAAVQTCRGSHTHTLVTDPDDAANVYVYNSGTSSMRSGAELAGCKDHPLTTDPVTDQTVTRWQIEVIQVPLAAPQTAEIVSTPRLFSNGAVLNGLNNTQAGTQHPSGTAYSPLPNTNACHDITAFPEIGLAAGACQGNGILFDISDPANPVRLDAVSDPNFSYWHSATFNNDGTKVLFTDEWGGGTNPRCRSTDQPQWGADAIFDIVGGQLEFRSYYKLPVPQTSQENCVAHNGSIVPVPGRDIMAQAWYQGGLSLVDFTDSSNPKEIAYFDRGPMNASSLVLGGLWSTYWFNGNIFGTEIARGFDVFGLTPTRELSVNEIAAASQVQLDAFNAQLQPMIEWDPSYAVSRSYFDQLVRADGIEPKAAQDLEAKISKAEGFSESGQDSAAAAQLNAAAEQLDSEAKRVERGKSSGDADGLRALADSLRELADSFA